MKKSLKFALTVISLIFLVFLCFFVYYFSATLSVKLEPDKLVNLERTITFLDNEEQIITEQADGVSVTEIEKIPDHVKNAFIAIEDKRFYSHNGIDFKSIARAVINNIKSLSLKEGASTISQQLIKNTHLTNEKTFRRKILEFKLAKKLEKNYSKDEILQIYLNTIYFGDGCYGITSASKHFFNKTVSELNVNEGATLAGIIKAPSTYSPIHQIEKCNKRKNIVLYEMFKQNFITESEYLQYKNVDVKISSAECNNNGFLNLVNNELLKIINNSPYFDKNIKVKTSLNTYMQKTINDVMADFDDINTEKSVILLDKTGNILAYSSTCGNVNRQLGSIIKPILVYAPAINENIVTQYSFIHDNKTNFNGYAPSNYNDKYYGIITVSQALAKSSNVCAVKLLNDLSVDKALNYANKTDLSFTENDKNLSLALGSSENGEKLSNISACYNIFNNDGFYSSPSCVISIIDSNNRHLYKKHDKFTKFIDLDTVSIMNDMLKLTVTDGTAKKLNTLNFDLYAKTGTVGSKNGNTDAYVISYTSDYTLGVWLGNKTGAFLDNTITGGTTPCTIASEIWRKIYADKPLPKPIDCKTNLHSVKLDKIAYEQDGKMILADENAPERYVFEAKLKGQQTPKIKSNRFTNPQIDEYSISTVNNCQIKIKLCHAEYINALIYKINDNKKQLVFNSKNNGSIFIDSLACDGKTYRYSIIPYFNNGDKTFLGKEILTKKIKSPSSGLGENWWDNEFN